MYDKRYASSFAWRGRKAWKENETRFEIGHQYVIDLVFNFVDVKMFPWLPLWMLIVYWFE